MLAEHLQPGGPQLPIHCEAVAAIEEEFARSHRSASRCHL